MPAWKMSKMCADCPFANSGPGLHLRRTLRASRWQEIKNKLLGGGHFICHKTTEETGDGSKRICAGSIEWQKKRGIVSDLYQVMERLDWFARKRNGHRASPS